VSWKRGSPSWWTRTTIRRAKPTSTDQPRQEPFWGPARPCPTSSTASGAPAHRPACASRTSPLCRSTTGRCAAPRRHPPLRRVPAAGQPWRVNTRP
jgi:hypothetical protein